MVQISLQNSGGKVVFLGWLHGNLRSNDGLVLKSPLVALGNCAWTDPFKFVFQ